MPTLNLLATANEIHRSTNMNISKKAIVIVTVTLLGSTIAATQSVSAKGQKETPTPQITEVKTSTTPNKLSENRRGYYDRYNDTWIYFKR